jgi:hypothetical protein
MTRPTRTYHIARQIMTPAGWTSVSSSSTSIDVITDNDFNGRYALLEKTQRRSTVPKIRLVSTYKTITTGTDLAKIQRTKTKLEAKATKGA